MGSVAEGGNWRHIAATVVGHAGGTTLVRLHDSESSLVHASSLIGQLPAGEAVTVLLVQPQGAYIIGTSPAPQEQSTVCIYGEEICFAHPRACFNPTDDYPCMRVKDHEGDCSSKLTAMLP